MKRSLFLVMLAALSFSPVTEAQGSRGSKQTQEPQEAKTGVRFVICSAKNTKVKSPLWYKVNDEEAKTVTISARTATPRIKPVGGKVEFYDSNPIPPDADKKTGKNKDADAPKEKWVAPKPVFSVDTSKAASKAFCIVIPETETKVDTIMLSESDFPKKGIHLINLSKKNVKISTSEKGDFSDSKTTLLKGGNLKGVNDSNKWSLTSSKHGDTMAFQISYEGTRKERKKDAKGRTVKGPDGKPVMNTVKSEVTLRRSKFVVSERQSLITVLVDDPASDGVKMLGIQLAE